MQITQEFIDGLAVNEVKIMSKIADELHIQVRQVSAVVSLVREGCTIPFISRYRKEAHGSLDEVQVASVTHNFTSFSNLETRRLEIIKGIYSQGKLSEDLYDNIERCPTLAGLEDIYLPYKRKKKTRGMVAQEKGLEPLAEFILLHDDSKVKAKAFDFVKVDAEHPELEVASAEDAIVGAMDIIAEKVSQSPDNRAAVKNFYIKDGHIQVKGVGDEAKKAQSVYQMYWEYDEALASLKAHRILAINRGERDGELEVTIDIDEDSASKLLQNRYDINNQYHRAAIDDGLRRLLSPAVVREIRGDEADAADDHGINVFSQNFKNLLMQQPIKGTRVLGIDPGIRTGTKCAGLDETGKFLGYFMIYQEREIEQGKKLIAAACKKYETKLIAIGNGTGSHEVQLLVADTISEYKLDVQYTVVDEDGASVYSASDIAREEFPELDLTIRGAISIGRRLQDPLAELVKIDPKSIGVGLYQHDVNQKKLSDSVDEVVGSVVNKVGVNINTASYSLLKYISGINASLAKKIVKFRDENGVIKSRADLKKVPGMGPKSYEQCAGFLKIPESSNPLDNTWVHPENYMLANEILTTVKKEGNIDHDKRALIKEKYSVGDATLDDIVAEIKKPSRDPREDYPKPIMQKGVVTFEDLYEGMMVTGKVKNVVDFGAFVDIGIKESALIHISELADHFVEDPMEMLKVGDVKEYRIISLDLTRRRIGLSLKTERNDAKDNSQIDADSSGKKRVVVVKKASDAGKETARPETRSQSNKVTTAQYKPQTNRNSPDDDGMSYNPFANLKKKK